MGLTDSRHVVALPLATVSALTATGAQGNADQVYELRSAGQAGGEELAAAFGDWLRGRGESAASELPVTEFSRQLAEFLGAAGWGRVTLTSLHDLIAAVDITDAWEARSVGKSVAPSCHMTTGALAAFFSLFSAYAVAALEVECAAVSAPRCRILLGPPAVLEEVYSRLAEGISYETTLAQLSGVMASA